MKQHAEKEINLPTLLCDKKGNLNPEAIGYARTPMIESNLTGHLMRKKKWNYWCVYGEDILFSTAITHLDYAAICTVYFLEYETQRYFEKTITIPLGAKVKMPTTVLDTIKFANNDLTIQLTYFNGDTHLSVATPDFDGEPLHAELTIQHLAEDESLNVVIPWNRQTFHFTAKQHTLPTSGIVKMGDRRYVFTEDECFAVLDYGRGVWPRETMRNWAMASQRIRGRRIGLNFGGKWTDGTGMTENAVFIDGTMIKIHEDVLFTYDRAHFMKTWHIKTKFSSTVALTFTPFFERVSTSNAKLVRAETHQLIGYFNGHITLADGHILNIQQMLGSVEEQVAKW